MPTTRASTSRKNSAPRRRRCTNSMITQGWDMTSARWTRGRGRARTGRSRVGHRLVGGQPADRLTGVIQAVGVDAVAHGRRVVVGQPVQGDGGAQVGTREPHAGQVRVEPAVDGDRAVMLADVVLVLAP